MSLKAFHICFIVLSSSVALGFGVWAFQNLERNGSRLVVGAGSVVVAGSLLGYGSWFLRKTRDLRVP
jgi:hypothetical protein